MSETSRAWSWRHAFASSDLPPTTKHVLHTLGMFMNELGEGCYPSVADICRYSGLDKKTVLKHLAAARDAGWISVSQHGYRGQKWKRNEYAARWPERDLTAPAAPEDGAEGGGAAPPPSEGPKAVESVPEGGGTEGPKVVEQVHQDKTSPVTPPDTSPVEREARASEREEGEPESGEPEDPKRVEAEGWALLRDWPGFAGMPKEPAMRIWRTLSPEERAEAKRKFPAWLALLKAQRKSHVPAPSTYLGQRLFAEVPEPEEERPAALEAAPFGKLWQAARIKRLLAGPTLRADLTAFQRRLIETGQAEESALRLESQAKCGFPAINRLHELAAFGRGVMVAPELEPLGETMEPVRVGSELWEAWRRAHEARGWPWLPDTGKVEWVYFPAGGPAGLSAFEAALEAGSGAMSEAAE